MKLYQAPLEGISGYIYRKALFDYFGGVDKYFAPFIRPYERVIIIDKDRNQLCPEHNEGYELVPQILTMNVEGFLELTKWLYDNYGYEEFNLNFGCPSGTVVSKGRGAGVFEDLERLDDFLDRIYSACPYKISVKTRTGLHNTNEFDKILEIYNKYPLSELIIHPRVRDEYYKGEPHREMYPYYAEKSKAPTVYNGDIVSAEALQDVESIFNRGLHNTDDSFVKLSNSENVSQCDTFMIGRGMLANPSIFRELKGGPSASADELRDFVDYIRDGYISDFSGEVPVLHKMKEIWTYMGPYLVMKYDIDEKLVKKLLKSKHLKEYNVYKDEILRTKW